MDLDVAVSTKACKKLVVVLIYGNFFCYCQKFIFVNIYFSRIIFHFESINTYLSLLYKIMQMFCSLYVILEIPSFETRK
jgi:hypothetical protein